IADPRLADANLELEVLAEAMAFDFQVQNAHAADERLPRVPIHVPAKGWILARQECERVLQFLLVGTALRLDRHAYHRFGKLDRFKKDRMLQVAEGVAGD